VRDDPERINEISNIAELLARETARDSKNVILLGDFNVFDREDDETMKALERPGFVVPDAIRASHTNQLGNKQYDQIAVLKRDIHLVSSGRGGVVDYYKSVFRTNGEYANERKRRGRSFKDWRSYQMSDHLVLWLELTI
jgi:endonuclease/exonuclease/phosphatase family metal-dependent hydrolase